VDDVVRPPLSDNPQKIISRAEAKALGLKTYISGFPCTAGHRAEKFVSDSRCVVCAGENTSTVPNWTAPPARTREERLAYQAAYGAKHREPSRRGWCHRYYEAQE
jgi:hypothetical protein